MAEALLVGVLRGVIGKAADALVQNITGMWGIDADRDKLVRHLTYVSSKLAHAEERSENDPDVKEWMKALKAVAYKADDVLDHLEYEALRRQAQGNCSTTSKVLSHFTSDNPLLLRLKMSRELKDVLHKIDELVKEMNNFGLDVRAEVPQVLYRQTHSSLDVSEEIYGRDDDKEKLVKLLLDQQHQENVEVLPIIGMGGLGKTTLAKMVYNDIRIQKHFQLKMWYCVSDNFEPLSLVRYVIQLATKERCDLPDNIELLRVKLVDIIGRQRFLLILDDVWNEDQHKWEEHLKPLLCSSIGGSGSIIVVTSRSPNVASIMGTLLPHEVACMSDDDSWKLFSKKAFSKGVQENEEFIIIGRHIVKKCKGLPLALKTMGGLMSSKQQVQEWATIADSNICDTSGGKDYVLPIQKLSYKYLSSEMKHCFTFCAMFPKGSEMKKDELIQLWMANHFIHGEGTIDLTQKGEFIFNELVWRAFLQDVKESDGIFKYKIFYYNHSQIVCKMHDLMHDLAKDATEEYACAQELIQRKALIKSVRHVQTSSHEFSEIRGLLKSASSIHTLLVGPPISIKMRIKEFKLKSPRALCWTGLSDRLPKYLKYLKYLDLSGTSIIRLPDPICIMYNLQTLRLNYCYRLQYLPEDLATSLKKLSHIYLLTCDKLEGMPPKMSLLCNLCTLTTFVVGTKDGCGIEELKDMKQLSNRLELHKLRNVKSGSKANLHEKRNLCELSLNWGYYRAGDILTKEDIKNEEEVIESLVPPSDLKVLEVYGYHGLQVPQWMRDPQMFRCLKTLTIFSWLRCKDIPLNLLSPSLETLHLAHMDNLTMLCKSIDMEAAGCDNVAQVLPRLKCLTLEFCLNMERWTEEPRSLMFPRLEELQVAGCPKLATLPEGPLLKQISCCSANIPWMKNFFSEDFVPVSMPLANWPSLVKLEVGGISLNMDLSIGEQKGQSSIPLGALRCLIIWGDDAFASILQLGLAGYLAHVEELEIRCVECEKLWELSKKILLLPRLRLKVLIINVCEGLVEIPKLPSSLEKLKISSCQRLVALPSNLGNLTKLRDLDVWDCDALKELPNGMDGLTSLEKLEIKFCQGIEEFPPGLLQRLPSLKKLHIMRNPVLQRRCREGGVYFDLVSSIRDTYFGTHELQLAQKQGIGRFKPLCGVVDCQQRCIRFWD